MVPHLQPQLLEYDLKNSYRVLREELELNQSPVHIYLPEQKIFENIKIFYCVLYILINHVIMKGKVQRK